MQIYHYDERTGQLIGQSVADADPVDIGNWLVPAHATNVAPPDDVPGTTRHFLAGGWEYRDIPPPPPPEPPAPPAPPVEQVQQVQPEPGAAA